MSYYERERRNPTHQPNDQPELSKAFKRLYAALRAFSSITGEKIKTIIRKDMHDLHTVGTSVKGTDNHRNSNARR